MRKWPLRQSRHGLGRHRPVGALVSGAAAVLLSAVIGAVASAYAGEVLPLVAALAAAGTAPLAAGLWRRRAVVVPWALLALGTATALSFSEEADPARAPLFAAGLLAVGELAYWSLETRESRPAVPGIAPRRIALLSGLVAASIALGAGLVSVARVEPGGGLLLETAGVAAAVCLAAAVLALSRRVT